MIVRLTLCTIVVVFLLLAGCSEQLRPRQPGILIVSDSIGNGFGLAAPYPTRIAAMRSEPVYNNSETGRLTSEALEIFPGLLDKHVPTQVIILLGTNDARKSRTESTIENLQEMINLAARSGANVMLAHCLRYRIPWI